MKLDRISVTHVRVPLHEPFRISSGAVSEKDAIVVALRSEGLTGYGESSPMSGSFYSSDTPETSWQELTQILAPALIHKSFENPAALNEALDSLLAGNFTKTGIETAFWDLISQSHGKPLAVELGGTRQQVESGLAVGLYPDIPATLRTIERYLADGYRRVKLKIEPGRDVDLMQAARKAFPDAPLFIDANAAYTIADLEIFRALDDLSLMMFEQPFPADSLAELAQLQRTVRTPVCLDESLDSAAQLHRAIDLGSFRIANFKIQRVGGFHNALEMYRICRDHKIPAWVGTMPELGIGQAQGAALAALDGFVYPTDVEASARWFRDDIIQPFLEVHNGLIHLPQTAGLGYSIHNAKLDRYKICSEEFS